MGPGGCWGPGAWAGGWLPDPLNGARVGRVLFPLVRELLGTRLRHPAPCRSPPLQVEWENAELRGQLLGVTQERDSALRKSQGLQSKLESLEQVLKVRRLHRRGEGLGPWRKEKVGAENAPYVGHWGRRPRPASLALLWPRFPS